jgi:peptidoglycan/LPS O-acetylase OafA/YrhL
MGTRMSVWEKFQHYAGRVYVFETKNHFAIGKYTFSEYLFMLIVALVFAYVVPQILPNDTLTTIIAALIGLYILYYIACFILSGGRGRIVDVMN